MAGWPVKGGTWAISRRSTHRSVIADLIGRWRNRNPAAKSCIGRTAHDVAQEYFTIHCQCREFLASASGFRANNAQPEGLALTAIAPYISKRNAFQKNRISPK
jgi:hypothetical protein